LGTTVVVVVGVVVEVLVVVDVTAVEVAVVVVFEVVVLPPHPAKMIEVNNRIVSKINTFFMLPPY